MNSSTAFTAPAVRLGRSYVNRSTASTCCTTRRVMRTVMVSTSTPTKTTPSIDTTTETQKKSKQPDMYRLYIYNDPFNKREQVVQILLKTCPELSFSKAHAVMDQAHHYGRALVLVITQEIAEHYCACINSAGVMSTIEPDN